MKELLSNMCHFSLHFSKKKLHGPPGEFQSSVLGSFCSLVNKRNNNKMLFPLLIGFSCVFLFYPRTQYLFSVFHLPISVIFF